MMSMNSYKTKHEDKHDIIYYYFNEKCSINADYIYIRMLTKITQQKNTQINNLFRKKITYTIHLYSSFIQLHQGLHLGLSLNKIS